jgi:hypothetical protein
MFVTLLDISILVKLLQLLNASLPILTKLKAVIPQEHQKLFDEFVEVFGDKHNLIAENYYVRGFKIGLRLGVESCDFSDIDENSEK